LIILDIHVWGKKGNRMGFNQQQQQQQQEQEQEQQEQE